MYDDIVAYTRSSEATDKAKISVDKQPVAYEIYTSYRKERKKSKTRWTLQYCEGSPHEQY